MRSYILVSLLLAVGLLVAGAASTSCGGDDDCSHCCKCDCGSSSISFSGADCIDCADACENGIEVPILGHLDGCGEDFVSYEEFKDQDACE